MTTYLLSLADLLFTIHALSMGAVEKLKGATMNEDTYKGFLCGKRLTGRYVVCIDDFHGNREEFIHGLRLAGYHGEVRFA